VANAQKEIASQRRIVGSSELETEGGMEIRGGLFEGRLLLTDKTGERHGMYLG